jgi:hypothetical protein
MCLEFDLGCDALNGKPDFTPVMDYESGDLPEM